MASLGKGRSVEVGDLEERRYELQAAQHNPSRLERQLRESAKRAPFGRDVELC